MMVGRRQKPFFEMVRLLRTIEADHDDFASVKALNLLVLKEIIRAERMQDKHRAAHKELIRQLKTGRGSKEISKALRTKVKRTAGFINGYAKQIYIWNPPLLAASPPAFGASDIPSAKSGRRIVVGS